MAADEGTTSPKTKPLAHAVAAQLPQCAKYLGGDRATRLHWILADGTNPKRREKILVTKQ
jgi:hypothetical protein